jgi:two-component system, NtrC family, nitrogen regulation response regulator NtrX
VNCAAIPDELIESELFGHEKGSFTGAVERQIGKFEQADKGTIFLDEIGDMSLKTQAKVLRVLQEQELERLGSNRIIKVDVRVIAATNKNLEQEMQTGGFREDLFYRLNVIPILVPPLRERRDDIPLLVRHFADLFSRENNFRRKAFSVDAMEALRLHQWRGNIRELRNTVERLMIMAPGDTIGAADLQLATGGAARPAEGAPVAAAAVDNAFLRAPTLQEFKSTSERTYLVAKLRENQWNISKTAEVIDTPRSNLYKKLEQYAISQESDG